MQAPATKPLRPGRPPRRISDDELGEMYAAWDAGGSLTSIAVRFHMRLERARKIIESSGRVIEFRTGARSGKFHTKWKGGRVKLSKGYIGVFAEPADPVAWAMRKNKVYVPEHRLVMARALGRTLSDTETVHHINGDRSDNRLENLQLHQGEHGSGIAMRCRSCGSRDLEAVPIAYR